MSTLEYYIHHRGYKGEDPERDAALVALATLRAIAAWMADPANEGYLIDGGFGYCPICAKWPGEHTPTCLVTRARIALQTP